MQEFTQEFADDSAEPIIGMDVFDDEDEPDGKIDFEEFAMSARMIPGIHANFPGLSEFMSSFVDMFCGINQSWRTCVMLNDHKTVPN